MPYVESAQRTKEAVAAARIVLMREGVGRTTMRAVAAEAGIPLGTLQYVFPSKQGLLKAVIEDVVDEIAGVLRGAADTKAGLNDAFRRGTGNFWSQLVDEHRNLQLVQYELVTHALRTSGLEDLPAWQYERYRGRRGLVPGGGESGRRALCGVLRALGPGAGGRYRRADPATCRQSGSRTFGGRPGVAHRDADCSGGGGARRVVPLP
ncbi:TetR/AcrR family transcriptional regulator [Mycobacteroides abscessus subsp. massiliense]|nr:TetR/AcrR family transcriptional regulator [Mycobacteroides abscessus subsp. massiliense]SKQ46068.1 Putative transcriptional regulator, TetR family [Mycobacteroides abscessus subsp. massiliense]